MITTDYENTYVSVQKARWDVLYLDRVMEVLSKASAPLSCHDIGFAIWGVDYLGHRHRAAHMGQMLKHLRQGGFIRVEKIAGEPMEIEVEEYQRECDENGNPRYIKVHDDEGNTYDMPNPKFNGYSCGKWVKIKRTVIPTTKVYSLVER